jgi:putative ABC transport system ATP-binding protein
MNKQLIQLHNVWKIYTLGDVQVPAVQKVNLSIEQGEYVAILGPSGSGKSTMMNLVGALDIPTRGKIMLGGRDIGNMTESELAQLRGKKIGFVFQQFNLIQTLTAQQNVELPMMFYGKSQAERNKRAQDLLGKVGLNHRLHHLPNKLSGGEQQRVAVARALANDPEVLLADEPTGNLDTKTGQQIMSLIGGLNKDGKTIIMVTHDLNLVRNAHRIVKIKDGKIIHDSKKRKPHAH